MEFYILGAETRKARAPNERLCRGTERGDWQMNAWTCLSVCLSVSLAVGDVGSV